MFIFFTYTKIAFFFEITRIKFIQMEEILYVPLEVCEKRIGFLINYHRHYKSD